MNEVKNEASERSEAERLQRVAMRLEQLRKELFEAIDYDIKMDGHHKSYEGRLSMIWPHRFTDEYAIEIDCYVIGPNRGHTWTGKSFDECIDACERDVRKWIKDNYEGWLRAFNYEA